MRGLRPLAWHCWPLHLVLVLDLVYSQQPLGVHQVQQTLPLGRHWRQDCHGR